MPGNIHKPFHVELVKRAGADPFPSQSRDDAQNPPIMDDLEEPEYQVEAILRARTKSWGRGKFRQALVKWVGWADPTWEPIEYVQDTKALEEFEAKYGPIRSSNGPEISKTGGFVGPAEPQILQQRRLRRQVNRSPGGGGGEL